MQKYNYTMTYKYACFNSSLSVLDFQSSIPLVLKSRLISRDSYIEGHPVQSLLHLFDESYSSEANYSSLDEDRTFEKKVNKKRGATDPARSANLASPWNRVMTLRSVTKSCSLKSQRNYVKMRTSFFSDSHQPRTFRAWNDMEMRIRYRFKDEE